MGKTTYEETLKFSKADSKERLGIYEDIGYVNPVFTEGRKGQGDGVDVIATKNGEEVKIIEKIRDESLHKLKRNTIFVEWYSNFEKKELGWGFTSTADEVAYFLFDSVMIVERPALTEVLEGLSAKPHFAKQVDDFTEYGIKNKKHARVMPSFPEVELFILDNGDHHSVELYINKNLLERDGVPIEECAFEEEEKKEEEIKK